MMYQVLSKDMIELEIVSYLPKTKRGFKSKAPLYEIINTILYKLKTGVQWECLPVGNLFSGEVLHYKTVFGHYRKWCKEDVWKSCWTEFLKKHKSKLDLDGSHTAVLRGARGEINIGHLCKEHFGDKSYHIGFGTHAGTVAAAHNWGNAVSIMKVNNSLP